MNFSISWSLEDRSAVQQQLAIMLQSQGGQYKPFISGEVNRTLKLLMDSNANMQSLFKGLGGSLGNLIPLGNEGLSNNDKGVTIDEAVRLFKDQGHTPLQKDIAQQEQLYLEYHIEDMPEVNALLQIGIDSSKEALNLNKVTELDMTKVKGNSKRKEDVHHDRRSKEIGIDEDQDNV